MAIQNRRGAYADFDPAKMVPGEWAVVLSGDSDSVNGTACYMCFAAGKVERIATVDEMKDYCTNFVQDTLEKLDAAVAAAGTSENNAKTYADNASASAKAAKESENSVATAISEANYQELYLENGVLMLYQSDASRSSLDFAIEDHKYLEVTYL